jgi:hypothetical protein
MIYVHLGLGIFNGANTKDIDIKSEIVICTTSYESHTFFFRICRLINEGVARVNQANK